MQSRLTICLAVWLVFVMPSGGAWGGDLTWQGCGIIKKGFLSNCAKSYEKQTGVRLHLTAGSTELGIEATASGAADVGGASRRLLRERGETSPGLKLAVVAWDALVVVVHPSNPLQDISRTDLLRVYERKLTNWEELGAPAGPILVVGRQEASSDISYSFRQLMGAELARPLPPPTIRLHSAAQVEELVARQPLTIALTGITSARKSKLKVLSIDGNAPDTESIAEGNYPYVRPLYLVYRPGANRGAEDFVRWMLSDQGQQVVEAEGAISLRQGWQLARKCPDLPGASQISNFESLHRRSHPIYASETPE